MNAAQYLKRQGWRGQGHSLDSENRGLAKPLLVTHKNDSTGLGTKANDFANQWWLKAWDTNADNTPVLTGPPTTTGLAIARHSNALYSRFIKAKSLVGTIGEEETVMSKSKSAADSAPPIAADAPAAKPEKAKKRKHEGTSEAPAQDKREKRARKSQEATTNGAVDAPAASAPAFFIDTTGKTPQKQVKNPGTSAGSTEHARNGPAIETQTSTAQNGTMHPDRVQLAKGLTPRKAPEANSNGQVSSGPQSSNYESRPIIAPPRRKHKQAQTAYFPDPSLSISEMVKRYNEDAKKPGPDGKLPKRRAPRNIRKEARAAKQAYEDAKAAEKGEKAAPVSTPMTKQERRYARKQKKPPTERRLLKMERKKRKQDAARQGAEERKKIEAEALRTVEEMKANGTMPDTSKPIEELLAEKQAELTSSLEAEKLREAGKQAVERLKTKGKMPLDKTEDEVLEEQIQKIKKYREDMAQAKAEGKPWPPPRKGPDFSHVELPELDVPKFRTVTLGIPIPGTKKRGSLKELRRALEEAGLTKLQQAAYIAKALEEKKEARAEKEKIKEARRKGRKAARGRKKVLRQQGLAEANRLRKKKEKEERLASTDPEKAAKNADKAKKKARKAETLDHNTGVILAQRQQEKRAAGEKAGPASKLDVKQARRMARKLVRLAKKSRLSKEEVPAGFKLKRSQKLKLKGNGGRIPEWTAMDLAANVRSAQQDAIKAAEKSNKDRKTKKDKKPEVDAIASGAGYVSLE